MPHPVPLVGRPSFTSTISDPFRFKEGAEVRGGSGSYGRGLTVTKTHYDNTINENTND